MRFNCSAEAVSLILTVLSLCPCWSVGQGAAAYGPGGPEWAAGEEGDPEVLAKFQIVGRAAVHGVKPADWTPSALVLLDGEDLLSFIRLDGSFTVNDVPSGSYVVQIVSPSYRFEPVRVDITSMGKIRARRVNYVKTSEVVQLPYPLQMRCTGLHSYFIKRETWVWSDFLMNPMVLMMVLPLVIILLLPKVINTNDPGMRREMEQSMNMLNPNPELPDVSEIMTKFFAPPKSHSVKPGGGGHKSHRGSGPRRR